MPEVCRQRAVRELYTQALTAQARTNTVGAPRTETPPEAQTTRKAA
jgi:hypothetical protein